jgi:hypothetical protein
LKGQGARAKNRRKVLVEATEGCNINRGKFARKIKSTKFENKFCRLARRWFKNFQKLANIPPKGVFDRNTRTPSFLSMPSTFHAKRQGGGG